MRRTIHSARLRPPLARAVACLGLCLGLCLLACTARAQVSVLDDIATYAGADRTERLIAGGRKEGTLTLYSSARSDDLSALAAAFEDKYRIKVRVWRASSEVILSRIINESRGGRFDADVIETAGPDLAALASEQLLHPISSPVFADLDKSALVPDHAWTANRYSVLVAAYNTKLVAAADVPKRYSDLLDSKWHGRLGIEADDAHWFATVVTALGEHAGLDLFRGIASRNGVSMRKGHSLLANLVVSGEVPFALTVYGYHADQLKRAGAPIEKVYLPPVVVMPTGVAVLRKAPHPFAAVLFTDFMLSDGQAILAARDHIVTNRRYGGLPADLSVAFVDPSRYLDERDKWTRLFKDVFLDQGR